MAHSEFILTRARSQSAAYREVFGRWVTPFSLTDPI
jgi:hypothetical protein